MIPFGPQLIGQTEKALNALLTRLLDGTGLTEPQWVALRLAAQFDGDGPLAEFVRDRAFAADPEHLLADLRARGLVSGDRITQQGTALLERTREGIAQVTAPIWDGIPEQDATAATRALHTVLRQTRTTLEDLDSDASRPSLS